MLFHYFSSGATARQHRRAAARSNYNLGKPSQKKHVSDTRPTGPGNAAAAASATGAGKRPRLRSEGPAREALPRGAAGGEAPQGAAGGLAGESQARPRGFGEPGRVGLQRSSTAAPRMSRLIVSLISHGD